MDDSSYTILAILLQYNLRNSTPINRNSPLSETNFYPNDRRIMEISLYNPEFSLIGHIFSGPYKFRIRQVYCNTVKYQKYFSYIQASTA